MRECTFREFSEPRLVGGFDVGAAGWGSASRGGGVNARLIAGLRDAFALSATMREIPSVEKTVVVGSVGVVLGCQGRDRVGGESWILRSRSDG